MYDTDNQEKAPHRSTYGNDLAGGGSELESAKARIEELKRENTELKEKLHQVLNSTSWQITAPIRKAAAHRYIFKSGAKTVVSPRRWVSSAKSARNAFRRGGFRELGYSVLENSYYHQWIRANEPQTEDDYKAIVERDSKLTLQPKFSVLIPTYNTKISWLRDAIDSVIHQTYQNWELCIADDNSTDPRVRYVLEQYAAQDERIKVTFREENGHIAAASNSALGLATGDFVALLDHDDYLAKHALSEFAAKINDDQELDVIYSNEDKVDCDGIRMEPTFKSTWSREYFLSFMYIGHLTVYRTSIVKQVEGFRVGFEGSQDYDLALRVTEQTDKVGHIPSILYHWRKHPDSVSENIHAKPYAFTVGRKALQEAQERQESRAAGVDETRMLGIYRYRREREIALADVDAVVFEREGSRKSNDPLSEPQKKLFASTARVEIPKQFDMKAVDDALVSGASPYILLLDSNSRGVERDWIENLLELQTDPSVGAVAPRLIDSSKSHILSYGLLTLSTRVVNNFWGYTTEAPGYGNRLVTVQQVGAASSLALLLKRSALLQIREELLASEPHCWLAFELALGKLLLRRNLKTVISPFSSVIVPETFVFPFVETRHETWEPFLSRLGMSFPLDDDFYPIGLERWNGTYRLELK